MLYLELHWQEEEAYDDDNEGYSSLQFFNYHSFRLAGPTECSIFWGVGLSYHTKSNYHVKL